MAENNPNFLYELGVEPKTVKVAEPAPQKKTDEPPNLGKAIRLPVPDFNDPNRPLTCLEVDFPIAPINALSNLEGNAGKPIYQMSKWWARRRSSVFRSLLIAAATEAPADPSKAAQQVWEHYYCNHQKAGTFKKLKVLDPFMGGGTTLVEGARLGFQMTGVDLNPVAWFVVKNELACSDPEQVKALFDHIEKEVKPVIQPFYTTTCPRGHKGKWIDVESGKEVNIDPIDLPPEDRKKYRWEGPEVIYTFWAKHGQCQTLTCRHRTPIFRTPVIAEKKLSTDFIACKCPECGYGYDVELGETRIAPGAEHIVVDENDRFKTTSQPFAEMIKAYDRGSVEERKNRIELILDSIDDENAFSCPECKAFAGSGLKRIIEKHRGKKSEMFGEAVYDFKASAAKKKDLKIQKKAVSMFLLMHPKWLEGRVGFENEEEIGGFTGAETNRTYYWNKISLENNYLIEIRSNSLPTDLQTADGTIVSTSMGTIPKRAHFSCGKCGRQQNLLDSVKMTNHTSPVNMYALQCHCPQCEEEGYNYNGRYFKRVDEYDTGRIDKAENEWFTRCERDLSKYWPREELLESYMTHKLNGGIPNWGYTHWWKMFNSRQLLVHTQIIKIMLSVKNDEFALDVKEQVAGALQQYLRNQNMFCFWDLGYDKLVPMMSNANYHPKSLVVENCVFHKLGRGNFSSCSNGILEGLKWAIKPWEQAISAEHEKSKGTKYDLNDGVLVGNTDILCKSSSEITEIKTSSLDLAITDPPFGNNLFYADLADFFYVWLRIPLVEMYEGLLEQKYFKSVRTPHAIEAIDNSIEHPDDRESWEKDEFITKKFLEKIKQLSNNNDLDEKDQNPYYRPEPSSDFYCNTLTACWSQANQLLKPGGLMAFTFHHSEDAPWVDVLKALFNAGYILIATYPIRSDESKGDTAAFGSRKIEYDIIHVCRKRLEEPQPVSWARMRRWVKGEAEHLKTLLEHSHGKELPESDLRVILRGKSLEFYSRHYGQVLTGDNQVLSVQDALLGINQILDDMIEESQGISRQRPPEAEPATRLYLRIFSGKPSIERNELHKTLRGTGVSQAHLEARGWVVEVGTTVHVVPVSERFAFFTTPGRNRKVLKTDLDQAFFLIGAAGADSGINIVNELDKRSFILKKSVDGILKWFADTDTDEKIRFASQLALDLVTQWRTKPEKPVEAEQLSLFEMLEAEEN